MTTSDGDWDWNPDDHDDACEIWAGGTCDCEDSDWGLDTDDDWEDDNEIPPGHAADPPLQGDARPLRRRSSDPRLGSGVRQAAD